MYTLTDQSDPALTIHIPGPEVTGVGELEDFGRAENRPLNALNTDGITV